MSGERTKRCIEICNGCKFFDYKKNKENIYYSCKLDRYYVRGNACYGLICEYDYETTCLHSECKYRLEHMVMSRLIADSR